MAVEIERKFLVVNESWKNFATETHRLVDGLLSEATDGTKVRVRISDGAASLAVKSRRRGLSRDEFEYPIPLADAERLVAHCEGRVIEKVRHFAPWRGHLWEIDVYEGVMAGIVIAELELDAEDERFDWPPWAGDDVTADPAYAKHAMFEKRMRERAAARDPA
jgi:CYTH domain-containing protein